ncbi:MAG: carbon-nitrogen hydrolase family protein [Thermoplasmata archaeon]|nr:carbon-nitrogen hydrolase family protein [Thermoplasmata archaeon]
MKLLLAQCAPVVGDLDANLAKLESIITKSEADLTVFPELFLSGYIPRDNLAEIAEDIEGPTMANLRTICRESEKALVTGIPLRHPKVKGQITNSAVAIDKNGNVGRYDKTYLPTFGPFEENLYFTPGSSEFVTDVSDLKIGVIICYDLFFPELSKLLALKGADLIICISASPTATVANFKKLIPGRALENATYVAYVNNVGMHLDLIFGGESRLVDPRGDVAAEARPLEEDLIYCDIDFSKLEFARRMRPTARDSRTEVFQAIFDLKKFG